MDAPLRSRGASPWPGLSGAILFATDFGVAAEEAWPYVLALGRTLALPVRILHVVEAVSASCAMSPIWATLGLLESLRRDAENRLQEMQREAAGAGVAMHAEVVVGRVRSEIRRAVLEGGASILVLGSRPGCGLLRRVVRGRVVEWAIRSAPCPVLTVPERSGLLQRERDPVQGRPIGEQPKAA